MLTMAQKIYRHRKAGGSVFWVEGQFKYRVVYARTENGALQVIDTKHGVWMSVRERDIVFE